MRKIGRIIRVYAFTTSLAGCLLAAYAIREQGAYITTLEASAQQYAMLGHAMASRISQLELDTVTAPLRNGRVLQVEATAYTNSRDETWPYHDGVTAIGLPAEAHRRIVAVDPDVIPLRSRVWIPGRGWHIAGDVGGAIQGKRIDILMATKEEAFLWGRQRVTVVVVPPAGDAT